MDQPKDESIKKMWNYAEKFAEKSGTHLHPDRYITEGVVLGLAHHIDTYGRPICPCNFYPTKDGRRMFILRTQLYPENIVRTLDVLGCTYDPKSIARAMAQWNALDLEDAFADRKVIGTYARTREEWLAHPQGIWLNQRPVVEIIKIGDSDPRPFAKDAARPLSGVRVLDTPGHTQGHVSLALAGGDGLIIAGDVLTHAIVSFRYPQWRPAADHVPDQAVATRKKLLDRLATDRSRLIGFHLPYPGHGMVERKDGAYRFVSVA